LAGRQPRQPSVRPVGAELKVGYSLVCTETVTYPQPFLVTTGAASQPVTVVAPPPTITAAKQSASVWREGSKLAQISRRRKAPPVGRTFSFVLNEPASVTLSFTQRVTGSSVHHMCVARTRRNARRRSCRRTVTVGRLSFAGLSGPNQGCLPGPRLAQNEAPAGSLHARDRRHQHRLAARVVELHDSLATAIRSRLRRRDELDQLWGARQRHCLQTTLRSRWLFGSADRRYVRPDQLRRLLIDRSLAPAAVAVLEMRKRGARRDGVDLIVSVIVKGDVNKGVVGEAQHDVTHGVWLRLSQLRKDSFDPPLVLISSISRLHRVTGNQSLVHGTPHCGRTVSQEIVDGRIAMRRKPDRRTAQRARGPEHDPAAARR
jgi:hypothetical protein